MTDQELKEAFKEAVREWIDEKFATFGKWTATTLGVVIFGWVIYGIISISGWHRLP